MTSIDFDNIRANNPLSEVIPRYLGPGELRAGRRWWLCPHHQEKTPSFSIVPGAEKFVCFGCGVRGDVIDFVERAERLAGVSEAFFFLSRKENPGTRQPNPSPDPVSLKADQERRIARAKGIWAGTVPIGGTHAEDYLFSRCLYGPFPGSLRFYPRLNYFEGPAASPIYLPALVAGVASLSGGEVKGVSVTFLDPQKPRKAQISTPRKCFGRVSGCGILLAALKDHVLVGEGIETTLSAMQLTGLPGVAAVSTSGLRTLNLPDLVKKIIIAADADTAGEQAAEVAKARWTDAGILVRVIKPRVGKDFNDEIKAERGAP